MATDKQVARYISRAVVAARAFGLPIRAVSMDARGSFAEAILDQSVDPVAAGLLASRGMNPDGYQIPFHSLFPYDSCQVLPRLLF